jgi:hypothetical protein
VRPAGSAMPMTRFPVRSRSGGWAEFPLQPRLDADGPVVGITALSRDITQPVQRRNALQEQAQQAERRHHAATDLVA